MARQGSLYAGLPPDVRAGLRRINRQDAYKREFAAALADPGSKLAALHRYFQAAKGIWKEEGPAGFAARAKAAAPVHPAPARALPCQSKNISQFPAAIELETACEAALPAGRKTPLSSGYRRRRAFEVEENILFALWMHGLKIARRAGRPDIDREQAITLGTRYALEFTVTLPGTVEPEASAKAFGEAWNEFNRQFLIPSPWCDAYLQVKEPHKSGRLHAHHLLLVNFDTWKNGKPPKFYKNHKTGKLQVIGSTCAEWIPALWEEFRGAYGPSLLEKYGLGRRHTLQPVQSAGEFSKYLSKYLTKGFKEERPEHLKSVRLVNYSQTFPRSCRVFTYRPYFFDGIQHRCRIEYLTKPKRDQAGQITKEAEKARRWEMETAFSFNGPAGRYRRQMLSKIGPMFGAAKIEDMQSIFGPRFAWYTEPLIALSEASEEKWAELEDGALAYRLAGIYRYTAIEPIMINETGRRQKYSEVAAMQDEDRRKYRFAWYFQDQISGNLLGMKAVEIYLREYFVDYFEKAKARAKAIAAGNGDQNRTISRTYAPL